MNNQFTPSALIPFITALNADIRNDPTSGYGLSVLEATRSILRDRTVRPQKTKFLTQQQSGGVATHTINVGYDSTKVSRLVPYIDVRLGESRDDDIAGAVCEFELTLNNQGVISDGSNVRSHPFDNTDGKRTFVVSPFDSFTVVRIFGWIETRGRVYHRPFVLKKGSSNIVLKITNNYGPSTIVIPGVNDRQQLLFLDYAAMAMR